MTGPLRFPTGLILAHGGAGARIVTPIQLACLAEALVTGHRVLRRGGSAVTAVEATINIMEDSGLYNAGLGAHLQLDGVRRMDASIMEGGTLRAGAVAAIEQVRHPISAARFVMEKTAHVLLVGAHATRFARHFKLARQGPVRRDRPSSSPAKRNAAREAVTATGPQRRMLRLYRKMAGLETVGAVALDRHGNIASGSSTGGIAFMLPGRVGDSPLIGCGVYADDAAGAVSMTGLGESIIRLAVAKEIVDRLAAGASPAMAVRQSLEKLVTRIQGAAGALVLAPDGRFAIRHTTPRMAAGWWAGTGKPVVQDRFR